ncbi:hypothetical protein RHMOL_Rhmol05G0039400 [Rhododendron molle]|uniref:Uncharacterized protein n=1 Tax=Rhododendron molle TaxID=49168 RepID=A0ACC0NKL6_RHOML|nr:hypothetical protein RHMOL_Rhmol05G0039400 [Rhododendron molle]
MNKLIRGGWTKPKGPGPPQKKAQSPDTRKAQDKQTLKPYRKSSTADAPNHDWPTTICRHRCPTQGQPSQHHRSAVELPTASQQIAKTPPP